VQNGYVVAGSILALPLLRWVKPSGAYMTTWERKKTKTEWGRGGGGYSIETDAYSTGHW